MNKYEFPNGFYWGASASGPQTEGIKNKANLNVWDAWFKEEPDRFYKHLSADIACDTYNRFKNDVQLMKAINFNSFRTSIQWSRLISDLETGELDQDGVRFYNEYIDEMINNGIEPFINLYHFDMPDYLMKKYGGFESKHVVDLYAKFAQSCFELFGDRVKYWITFNEPIVPIEFGYFYDAHKPNKVDPKLAFQVGFNTMLAHAKAVNIYKQMNLTGEIGTIVNLTPVYSRSENEHDIKAADMCDLIYNRSFLEPIINGTFPAQLISIAKEFNLVPEYSQSECEEIKRAKIDFVGLNYYVPRRVMAPRYEVNSNTPWMPDRYFDSYAMPGSRNNPYRDNNEIYPKALYDMAMNIKNNYGNIKWYLAEIGISMNNEEELLKDGIIEDDFRTNLLKEHFIQLHKAIEAGSNCFGVHNWTFIDNWSWLNSHRRRYGFYYLDLETRERTLKRNGYWFKEVIKNNGFKNI
ncbi:MAG: glycoside hydrolase family 1 protein [Mycoplasmatales bacterium]